MLFKNQRDNEYHFYLGYVSTTMYEVRELSDNVCYEFIKGLNAYNLFLLVNSFYTGKPVNSILSGLHCLLIKVAISMERS